MNRAVRESVCTVFKAVVDTFFHGNVEAIHLPVQFKASEVDEKTIVSRIVYSKFKMKTFFPRR